jgi:hypothetical protein
MSATLISLYGASGAAFGRAEGIWSPAGMRSFCARLSPALRSPPETLLRPPAKPYRADERSRGNATAPMAGGLPSACTPRAPGAAPSRSDARGQARTGDEYDAS